MCDGAQVGSAEEPQTELWALLVGARTTVGQMGDDPRFEFPDGAQVNQGEWDQFLDYIGRAHIRGAKRALTRLPSAPRCLACGGPFSGFGARIMKVLGRGGPSRMNPNWCAGCFEDAPAGGFVGTVGVLFADVRGSTALAETLSPTELADGYNQFYDLATRAIIRHGIIDKLIGDEVMGLYLPVLCDGRLADALVDDALTILHSLGYPGEPILNVGVGIGIGEAYVGHVGNNEVSDFTAIGDIVNTVARLQSAADGGQVVVPTSLATLAGVAGRTETLSLRGKSEPVSVRIMAA